MPELDLSRFRALGKGRIAEQALRDAELASRLAAYKGHVAGSYRAVTAEGMADIPSGCWISPKIDGELWFLALGDGDPCLINPRGTVIAGDLPVLAEARAASDKADGLVLIAGELFAETSERRCRVGDLTSLLGAVDQAEVGRLRFAAFDILPARDSSTPSYADRLVELNRLIASGVSLSIAATFNAVDCEILATLYEEHVASGRYEGLVVRARDGMIYKLKPSHSIDACILGFTVKADARDSARSILLGLVREDGGVQVWGACGNLGTDEHRRALLARLQGMKAESRYRHASDSGGLYTFVRPELVAEIKVTDLQAERSDGSPVTSMLLNFDEAGWQPQRPQPVASPLHPALVRLREDKHAGPVDARISQIADWLRKGGQATAPDALPKSALLRREAWKKETKGMLAVRKLVVWRTNKERIDPAYPAFVVHWTDYSPGRAAPLDREVRLAMDEPTAMQIADKMIADNIKKGWDKA